MSSTRPVIHQDIYRSAFLGIRSSIPVVLGYIPIGFAYGVLARRSGLTVSETTLMSVLVYAGSAQFIATSMLASAAGLMEIVLTTFLVNLRHLLMSAAISPHVRRVPEKWLALFMFWLTDETFAVSSTQLPGMNTTFPGRFRVEGYLAGLFVPSHTAWILSSLLGAVFAPVLGDGSLAGLDYALPAMFIALLVINVRGLRWGMVALISAAVSVGVFSRLGGSWNVVIATIVGATLGTVMTPEAWRRRDRSNQPSS